MYKTLAKTVTLESGYDMPVLGLGTWRLQGSTCSAVVAEAIALGYRAIDTAELYGNETEVGKGLSGIAREDIFLTSKVSADHLAPKDLVASCHASLERLHTDYLDLYLIHWPNDTVALADTLGAMNELVQKGWVRSIGVSNFDTDRLREAIETSAKPICVNQIEYHPYTHRDVLPAFCADHRVAVTAYSPLARGRILREPVLLDIGRHYGKSPAQVSLKWMLQQGHLVIPKAGRTEHLRDNADLDDWTLTQQEMDRITSIQREVRLVDSVFT